MSKVVSPGSPTTPPRLFVEMIAHRLGDGRDNWPNLYVQTTRKLSLDEDKRAGKLRGKRTIPWTVARSPALSRVVIRDDRSRTVSIGRYSRCV